MDSSSQNLSWRCATLQRKYKHEDHGEPKFTCTICWRPQYAPSKPKVLGSSARIVCKACWTSVVDLSICWVCGECIVRGDEVVSLGWCFWHRSCFGCLICGTKMSVPHIKSVFGRGESRIGKRMGVQLEKVPLCNVCSIEMSEDSPGEVLQKGLENVSKFDGGLSRERLQRWSEVSNEGVDGAVSVDGEVAATFTQPRSPLLNGHGLTESNEGCPTCSHGRLSIPNTSNLRILPHSSTGTRVSGDGSTEEHRNDSTDLHSRQLPFPEGEPNIYVSVFDPIGGPAFKPSKTKPLPKWMHLLPNNVSRDKEKQGRSTDDQTNNIPHEVSEQPSTKSRPSTQLQNDINDTLTYPPPQTQASRPTQPIAIPNAGAHARSKITFEPNLEIEPTGGGDRRVAQRSDAVESVYATPPEYSRPKTPFPRLTRPSLSDHETTSYFSHRLRENKEVEDMCCDLELEFRGPTPTPEQTSPRRLVSPPSSRRLSSIPTQSSEYLEKYRPKSTTPNYEKYIAKDPEPILNKLKRQRVGNQNLEQVADRMMKRRGEQARGPKLEDEEYGLDPRRRDLNQELRNLFCEE